MPQSFRPLNMEEEHTLLTRGKKLLYHKLLGHQIPVSKEYMYIRKTHNFSIDQIMECQLQMYEMAQKLVNTSLFSFQDLKISTMDIIVVLEDTLNITSSPLPISYPHAIEVPSNTFERHSIGSHVVDDVRILVTNFSMVKLVGFPTSNSTFTKQKGIKNTSLVDLLLNKGVMDSHSLHKVFHSFPKVVPSEKTSITIGVAIIDNIGSTIQMGGHTPRVVILNTSAQPMILGVQFAKKMGMLDSKLRKSMWQFHTASGNVKEVLRESSDLILINFNEGID